jgi:hypothetical protein
MLPFHMISTKNPRIPHSQPLPPFSPLLQKSRSRKSFPCRSYKLFHSPYPVTPLFATLTQTRGVYTNNSHSGPRAAQPLAAYPLSSNPPFLPPFCTISQNALFCFQSLAHSSAIKGEGGVGALHPAAYPLAARPFPAPSPSETASPLATRHSPLATSSNTESTQFHVLPGFNDAVKAGPA